METRWDKSATHCKLDQLPLLESAKARCVGGSLPSIRKMFMMAVMSGSGPETACIDFNPQGFG